MYNNLLLINNYALIDRLVYQPIQPIKKMSELEPQPEPVEPNHCVQLMANVMNYLSGSLYEGLFKKCHEDALRELNSIYDTVAKSPQQLPPYPMRSSFYDNFIFLSPVTDTDDPDYTRYKRELFRFTKFTNP